MHLQHIFSYFSHRFFLDLRLSTIHQPSDLSLAPNLGFTRLTLRLYTGSIIGENEGIESDEGGDSVTRYGTTNIIAGTYISVIRQQGLWGVVNKRLMFGCSAFLLILFVRPTCASLSNKWVCYLSCYFWLRLCNARALQKAPLQKSVAVSGSHHVSTRDLCLEARRE